MSKTDALPVVEVVWIDSMITDFAPVTVKELGYSTLTSVGYVVKETDEFLALAREYSDPNDHWRGVVCIPKVAITSRRFLLAAESPKGTYTMFPSWLDGHFRIVDHDRLECVHCPVVVTPPIPGHPEFLSFEQHLRAAHSESVPANKRY